MLKMTCDRCGKVVPEGGGGTNGGRCRIAKLATGKEIVVDLCGPCQIGTYATLTKMVADWQTRATKAA